MKQNLTGGYCPKCDTVWAAPGVCNCSQVSELEQLTKCSVLCKAIWNAAIKAAALIGYDNKQKEEIRRLKR